MRANCIEVQDKDSNMNPAKEYGIIWDLDGTLVDTQEIHFQAWAALARELNRPLARQTFEATFGRRNADIVPLIFGKELTEPEVASLGERKEELYRAAARKGVELLPGVRSLLEELRFTGVPQAIGSSAPRANIDLIMQLTGMAHFFKAVVSMEDTQRGKPDPQVFQIAAERLGLSPSRCVVFEDAVAGIQAAKNGGMKSIAVRSFGHHPEDTLYRAGAGLVVESLEEVSVDAIRSLIDGD
jgi:beta-phosphoglucomutase